MHHRTLILAAWTLTGVAAAQTYSVTDLGSLNGGTSTAWGLNARGEVAGYSSHPNHSNVAFRSSPGSGPQDLGVPPNNSASFGLAIDDGGRVVGYGGLSFEDSRAFVSDPGSPTLTLLPDLGGNEAWARDVNDVGQVAGESKAPNGLPHAVVWDGGSIVDVGALLGATTSNAAAISDTGYVVGRADASPYRYRAGAFTILPSLGGNPRPNDVNDLGTVVGSAWQVQGVGCTNCDSRAVLWKDGAATVLGALAPPTAAAMSSAALGVNNLEQVVGYSTTSPLGSHHGFVWDAANGMRDLNDLVPAGVTVTWAVDVNDAGQIAAFGSFGSGPQRALLLTPDDGPPVMVNPQPGVAGAVNRFEMLGATPHGTVGFFAGFGFGASPLPFCGTSLDVASPLLFAVLGADADGTAIVDLHVPPVAAGLEAVLQALDLSSCRVTAVCVQTF